VHHSKPRSQLAIDETTGIRALAAIAKAAQVRLMKRDLLLVAEQSASLPDENRLSAVARRYAG
jgi:hypothetical protein